mmetsp:Transcript_1278/g.3730  ORF Transcript_1278/g.3730 Transcript_1278/m.3730 type:complete len:228 (+) Transcript_1278:1045-1728(+)
MDRSAGLQRLDAVRAQRGEPAAEPGRGHADAHRQLPGRCHRGLPADARLPGRCGAQRRCQPEKAAGRAHRFLGHRALDRPVPAEAARHRGHRAGVELQPHRDVSRLPEPDARRAGARAQPDAARAGKVRCDQEDLRQLWLHPLAMGTPAAQSAHESAGFSRASRAFPGGWRRGRPVPVAVGPWRWRRDVAGRSADRPPARVAVSCQPQPLGATPGAGAGGCGRRRGA